MPGLRGRFECGAKDVGKIVSEHLTFEMYVVEGKFRKRDGDVLEHVNIRKEMFDILKVIKLDNCRGCDQIYPRLQWECLPRKCWQFGIFVSR